MILGPCLLRSHRRAVRAVRADPCPGDSPSPSPASLRASPAAGRISLPVSALNTAPIPRSGALQPARRRSRRTRRRGLPRRDRSLRRAGGPVAGAGRRLWRTAERHRLGLSHRWTRRRTPLRRRGVVPRGFVCRRDRDVCLPRGQTVRPLPHRCRLRRSARGPLRGDRRRTALHDCVRCRGPVPGGVCVCGRRPVYAGRRGLHPADPASTSRSVAPSRRPPVRARPGPSARTAC
jgi:hypothetical protein